MPPEYMYQNTTYAQSERALIVLPEIFGLNAAMRETVDRFASQCQLLAFGLDFFYQLTGKPNDFNYKTEANIGAALMKEMKGEDFMNIFERTLKYITSDFPHVKEIVVCGFCFGGRLALLSGAEPMVTRIISFYGGGANIPFFLQGDSAVDALISVRHDDANLRIIGLFGNQDDHIPIEDREQTKTKLQSANIYYREYLFDAGHAFFNAHRESYNAAAAEQAWVKVKDFLAE